MNAFSACTYILQGVRYGWDKFQRSTMALYFWHEAFYISNFCTPPEYLGFEKQITSHFRVNHSSMMFIKLKFSEKEFIIFES